MFRTYFLLLFFSLCFILTSEAQEKITSYQGVAKSNYLNATHQVDGKVYFIATEQDRTLVIWEYDPATKTHAQLLREKRRDGFYILHSDVIYGRLFIFDTNSIIEVDIENKKINTVRQFEEFGWIGKVFYNDDLLFIVGAPSAGSIQYQIMLYDLLNDNIVDLIQDPRAYYGLALNKEIRTRIEGDEILMTTNGNESGLFIYDMTRSTFKTPEGADELSGKRLDDFVLHDPSTYYFIADRKDVWSVDIATRKAEKLMVVDSAQSADYLYLTDNSLVVQSLEYDNEFNPTSYLYQYNLLSQEIEIHVFGYLRQLSFVDDEGAFSNWPSVLTYLDFATDSIFDKLGSETWSASHFLHFDQKDNSVYFSARNEDSDYSIFSTPRIGNGLLPIDIPHNKSGFFNVFESDSSFLLRAVHEETGPSIYSIKNQMPDLAVPMFYGFEGNEYSLYPLGSNMYATNEYELFFDVEQVEKNIPFANSKDSLSFKSDFETIGNDLYVRISNEREGIWEYKQSADRANKISFTVLDSLQPFFNQLHSSGDHLYVQVNFPGHLHLCELDRITGDLDCLLDTSDLYENKIWGQPIWLGDQLCFHMESKKHGRELWAIADNIQDSYMVMDLSPDSNDTHYARDIVNGEGLSLFLTTPINPYGLMRSDGTRDGTHLLHPWQAGLEVVEYMDGYFYFLKSRTLYRTRGNVNDFEKMVFVDNSYTFKGWEGDIYFRTADRSLMKYTPGNADAEFIAEFGPGAARHFYPASGHLFYAVDQGLYSDLYATDGTTNGTNLILEDIGKPNVDPILFTVGDKVLFTHYSLGAGHELWISDGTQEGTMLLFDVNPGINSSYPEVLADHGGFVYFSAEFEEEGRQLFRIDREDISLISSLEDINSIPLEVYPNPAQDYIQIGAPDARSFENVRIVSADGKVVHQVQNLTVEQKINLQGIAPGIYFVSAEVGGSFYSGRFVKSE